MKQRVARAPTSPAPASSAYWGAGQALTAPALREMNLRAMRGDAIAPAAAERSVRGRLEDVLTALETFDGFESPRFLEELPVVIEEMKKAKDEIDAEFAEEQERAKKAREEEDAENAKLLDAAYAARDAAQDALALAPMETRDAVVAWLVGRAEWLREEKRRGGSPELETMAEETDAIASLLKKNRHLDIRPHLYALEKKL